MAGGLMAAAAGDGAAVTLPDRSTAPLGLAYRHLLGSAAVSAVGDGVRFTALPLLSAALLADPRQVAAVTAATTLPWLVLGLPVGALADRHDRVRMMVAADLLRFGALVLAVALLAGGQLGFAGLLVLAVALGVGEVMFDCASFAVLPAVVPAARLEAANGRLFTVQTVGRDLLGHAVGGVLYSVGRALPLVVDALSFVVSAVLLRQLPRQRPAAPEQAPRLWSDIVAGIRCVFGDRLLATLTLAGAVVNAVYLGQVAVLVLFVRQDLGFGPVGYALLLASGSVGGVAGGLVAERVVARVGKLLSLAGGLVLACLAGFGVLAGTAGTTVAGWAAMGFGVMLWNVVAVTLRQSSVPEELLGRVTGAYRLVAWGAMPVGALVFGAAVDAWGTRAAFGGGGAAIALLVPVVVVLLAGDARLVRSRPGDPDAQSPVTGSLP